MLNTVYLSVYLTFALCGTLPPSELLTADLEEKLQRLRPELIIQRERVEGE